MTKRLLEDAELVSWMEAMSMAFSKRNEDALRTAVTGFEECRAAAVSLKVRRIANVMQCALDHFHADAKLVDLAQQVPDAQHRLAHVLRLTDDAAHRTMELVERCSPLADHASREAERLICLQQQQTSAQELMPQLNAFVTLIAASMGAVRSNLVGVLIAQGYQDLSGQIIRSVMKLIQELEVSLSELLRVSGPDVPATGAHEPGSVEGPLIPGIARQSAVDDQMDVDVLLSQLGM